MLSAFEGLSRVVGRHLDEALSFPKCTMAEIQDSRKRKDTVDSCINGLEKWHGLEIIRNLNFSYTLRFPRMNFL